MHLQHTQKNQKLKAKKRDKTPVTQCAGQNSRPRILSDTKIRTLTGQFLGQEQKMHYLCRWRPIVIGHMRSNRGNTTYYAHLNLYYLKIFATRFGFIEELPSDN